MELFSFVAQWVRENIKKEEGQTMAEYGVVLAVITVLAIGAFSLLSSNIRDAISTVAGYLKP
jgi:Flp pilus assembly pilin Flp